MFEKQEQPAPKGLDYSLRSREQTARKGLECLRNGESPERVEVVRVPNPVIPLSGLISIIFLVPNGKYEANVRP